MLYKPVGGFGTDRVPNGPGAQALRVAPAPMPLSIYFRACATTINPIPTKTASVAPEGTYLKPAAAILSTA